MSSSRTLHTIDPDALYKHAFLMHQAGNLSEAISLYQQLLNQFPNETHVLNLLGAACLQSESFDEAIQILEKSLMIDPNQPMVLSNLGYGFHKHKRFAEAIVHCDRAIALDPDFADAHNNRGVALKELNRFQEALESYWNAIRLKPDFADAYNNRGVVLKELNRFQEALESYCDAITLKPGFADAHNNKGAVLCELRRFDEALISYDCAIHLYPDFAEAIFNRAVLLNKLQRFDEALMGYNDVIHLKPDFADPYFDRGIILFKSKRFEEALKNFDYAIELKPDFADAYNNRGFILKELNRFVDALASCDEASILKPDFADAHWNRAFLKLSLGDYKEGWRLYEWRWKTLLKGSERAFDEPLWLGEVPLSGKTILVYAEQGFGDVIQMCRYLPMLNALGADVILEVRSQLIPLLSTLKGSIKFVETGMELPVFDFQCPIMSLPLAFKTTVESIPSNVTYLFSEHDKQKEWRHRLGEKTKKRIGIAYSGLIDHLNDKNRSMQFNSLKQLLNLPFEFHLLQKEIRAEDVAVLTEFPQVKTHHENLNNFSDTAALINEMDLVISVDTSVAHLAGALGKPVWILLSWVPDFRWLLDRSDSPWYPTATLFRQTDLGNWESIVSDVRQKLVDMFEIQDSDLMITDPDALYRHAVLLHQAGHVKEAIPLYQQLLVRSPANSELLTLLGKAWLQIKNIPEGIQLLERSLKFSPNQPIALFSLGDAFYALRQFDEALKNYNQAIIFSPDAFEIYNNRAMVLNELGQFYEALTSWERAIELNPNFSEAYSNRGFILKKLNRLDEALISCDRALELNRNFADAYCNRSIILIELKRFGEALISCERAIALNPTFSTAYFNKALTQLLLGNYEEGWKLYESRWEGNLKASARVFNQPLWLGDALLSGKTILIYEEQGVGDVIQMCRYLHLLNALGANIILEVRSQLIPLLLTLKGNIKVIEKGDDLPLFDFYCPIMSLPLALKTTVETIPKGVPYLFVDSDKQKIWQGRLGEKTKKRIGFVCSGSATHNDDSKRSISLKLMQPLLSLPFEFHILQKEIRAEDMAVLTEFPHVKIHHENLVDFSDTAALIDEMDLVISVDTSVAHLAGALGKPVWVLLSWVPDFRWLLDRTDSPWYPTATLFRQPDLGNWESVIEDVCQKLKGLMNIKDSDLTTMDPDALYKHAFSLHQAGNARDAIPLYQQLHTQFPENTDILTLLGTAYLELENIPEGIRILEHSLKILPNQPVALSNLANSLYKLGRFEESVRCCDIAIDFDPGCAAAHNNRADALIMIKKFDEALISCERAISLKPDFAEAYCSRGSVLCKLEHFDEALANYDSSILLSPDLANAYSNRAIVLNELGRFDEALISCGRAVELKPDFANAQWNKSLIKLTLGDFEEGWKLYEWRWKSSQKDDVRVFDHPLWLGDTSLSGKTILIYPEQGLGDVIQASRYVYMLNALGAKVILEVPASLTSVIKTLQGNIEVIETGVQLPAFDFKCPIMSLPLAFKTTVETIPGNVPYLFSDSAKQKEWHDRLGEKRRHRIGIVCSGSTTHKDDSKRSIPLKLMLLLLNLPFEFHLLQKEIRSEDAAVLSEFPHVKTHHQKLNDFSDTASLINEMDLVISVDTSVAHLAGALGKPIWLLLSWVPDFRWLLDRTDSPWYPTATLFRQPERGDWESVIEGVFQRLQEGAF